MRIRFMFLTLIVFTTVLTLSAPYVALAQQNSTQTATTQDANGLNLEVKAAAEQDARNDLNKPLWFITGMSVVGCALVGGAVGCLVASSNDSGDGGLGFAPLIDFSDQAEIGGVIGLTAGTFAPLIWTYFYQSNPPPERLLGKSPEYVESYTNTYKAKTRQLRTFWAAAGTAIGCGLTIGLMRVQ